MTSQESTQPEHRMRAAGSARLVSVTKRVSSAIRCAYCHDDLGDLSTVCSACQTALHAECRVLLSKCPTLGCRESVFTLLAPEERFGPASSRPAFRRALASFAERHRTGPFTAVETEIDDLRAFLAETGTAHERHESLERARRAAGERERRATAPHPDPAAPAPLLGGDDEATRARLIEEREAEDRLRAREALVAAGFDPCREPASKDGYAPLPVLVLIQREAGNALIGILILPFTTAILTLLLVLVFTPASWLALLSRGRLRSPRLDATLEAIGECWVVEWFFPPFLLAAVAIFAIFGAGPDADVVAKLAVGFLAVFGYPIVRWYRLALGSSAKPPTPPGDTPS